MNTEYKYFENWMDLSVNELKSVLNTVKDIEFCRGKMDPFTEVNTLKHKSDVGNEVDRILDLCTIFLDREVYKDSGKPFRSGKKFNIVHLLTINPNTGLLAFTFIDDDSIVDIHQCNLKDVS